MGIVNVADFEGRAVTVQAAGAESRKTALVGELCQGVDLIHELGELGGTEEFLYRRDDRAGVDEVVGHSAVDILEAHALTHGTLETGEADADLILQKLADGPDAAVAEVVDIVGLADAVGQADEIADGGDHIGGQYVAGGELQRVHLDVIAEVLVAFHIGALRKDAHEGGIINVLVHAEGAENAVVLLIVVGKPQIEVGIDELVAQYADLLFEPFVRIDVNAQHARVLDGESLLVVNELTVGSQYLGGVGIDNVLRRVPARDARGEGELGVVLIPADAGKIVTLIEEEGIEEAPRALFRGGLAGTEPLVDLDETVGGVLSGGILLERLHKALLLAHQFDDGSVGAVTQSAEEGGDVELPLTVDLDVEQLGGIGLILQPRAAVGDDLGAEKVAAELIHRLGVVSAGAPDELGDYDALRTVDDEGALLGHEREIAHIDFLLLHLAGLGIDEAHADAKGRGIVDVPLLALGYVVLGMLLVDLVIGELENELFGKVLDGGNILEDFSESVINELTV